MSSTKATQCAICKDIPKKLFRCRYDNKKSWLFLCQVCLTKIKKEFSDHYQYGGTKKL